MDRQTADEVLECLVGERTLYHYYRDRYSIGLLRHLSRRQALRIAALKQSPYAQLLQKPRVRNILADSGGKEIDDMQLARHDYDADQTDFVLTLGTWGSELKRETCWKQTSRPGYNLVLQLNFCRRHDRLFQRLGYTGDSFNYRGHPVSERRNTLAWARIDLDWQTGTALIEEIQSDWIRRVAWLGERVAGRLKSGQQPADETRYCGLKCSLQTTQEYCRFALGRYAAIWAEAMLWATIAFVREELGLQRIYYHSEESGRLLKNIRGKLPPRSLYTDLPRKFCFVPTQETPEFLLRASGVGKAIRRREGLSFFQLT
ncbi:hypothetical protein [Accumulibacter sp.]|uniref:hypothetical protein n=1 Tax=Accumulibacter sp. TaxID=2053492 RepID=UPI0025911E72|nr:hypothetical protein [Accumulibacter sp.]MCM8579165.1 hypothetical protein [Accumulibacter sp.]